MYKSYVRSAMLYGSETWRLSKNEVAILRKGERSTVRAMYDVKSVDKRNTEEPMDMLGSKKAADKLARANGVRWNCHVLKQPDEDISMKVMVHEVDGKRKQGRPKTK